MKSLDLDELKAVRLDHHYKGVPLDAQVQLSDFGKQGWNVARGDLALPVTTLRANAISHNISTMASYCQRYGASLAPHGKTTMSPQLFNLQIAAGAWGITAATPSQMRVMRRYGVSRIILANQLVEPSALRWVADQLDADPSFDFLCLVDSPTAVARMDQILQDAGARRKLRALVEVGVAGGRGGARSEEEVLATAQAVAKSLTLELVGVETYEGLSARGGSAEDIKAVDALLHRVRQTTIDLSNRGLFAEDEIIVTAGGSVYFDRVVATLSDWSGTGLNVRLVLRSGCYVSHDSGRYHQMSPFDGRRSPDESSYLINALEAWAVVLSRPEPNLVVLGTGRRDVSFDVDLPIPLRAHYEDGTVSELVDCSTIKLMDQHAFLTVPTTTVLNPGDVVVLGLSHPCTAFDKFRLLPVIDDDFNVVDGVLTFF